MSMNSLLTILLTYKYIAIFPLAVIEGPFLAVLLGYLVHAQYVNLYITFLVLLSADILPDIFYYHLGKRGGKKVLESKYFANSKYTAEHLRVIEYLWNRHTKKTMFFAKISYGISLPLIISAGVAKMPLKRFILTSLPIGILQIGVFMFIGYHLGTSYAVAEKYMKYPGILAVILLIILLIGYVFLRKHVTKLFEKEEFAEQKGLERLNELRENKELENTNLTSDQSNYK